MKPTPVNHRAIALLSLASPSIRRITCALFVCALLAVAGCRSPLQRQVYSQEMAGEIRILEDQLYDADYQNRVLRDELKRVKAACEPVTDTQTRRQAVPPTTDYGPAFSSQPSIETFDPMELSDQPDLIYDNYPDPTETSPRRAPKINPSPSGTTESPSGDLTLPNVTTERTPAPNVTAPNVTAPALNDALENGFQELPPPRIPEPPGNETFRAPSIVPGSKVAPPPIPGSPEDVPPGKVDLREIEELLNYSSPTLPAPSPPDHIQLHPSLSSAHQFDQDDAADGLWIVVNVVDTEGKIINLNDFDVDASMTIVALDPSQNASAARIGRWDFSADEVKQFVRSIPVQGLHVPIQWQDIEPSGDEVLVHVRLQAEGEEMRCQGKLSLNTAAAMAKWMPRSDAIKKR